MPTKPKTDVVVIGLGAGGGTAVLPLAQAGLDVVGLEPGGRYSTRDYPADEIRNDIRNWLGRAKVNDEVPTQRRSAAETAGPAVAPGRMMNGVGGTSIHWTAQSWRLMPWNFRERSETIAYLIGRRRTGKVHDAARTSFGKGLKRRVDVVRLAELELDKPQAQLAPSFVQGLDLVTITIADHDTGHLKRGDSLFEQREDLRPQLVSADAEASDIATGLGK